MMRLALSFLLVSLAVAGCDSGTDLPEAERAALEVEVDAALADLEAAIGLARADDVASCRVLGLGGDACGEPTYARVYSVTDSDSAEIDSLATRLNRLERDYDAALGLVRECRTRTFPALEVSDGRCLFEAQAVPSQTSP